MSRNATDIQIGSNGAFLVPSTLGWEYLHILYVEREHFDSKKIVKVPMAAYVERVYDFGDLKQLQVD